MHVSVDGKLFLITTACKHLHEILYNIIIHVYKIDVIINNRHTQVGPSSIY